MSQEDVMGTNKFAECLDNIRRAFPDSLPHEPSAFDKGVIERLRETAALIESGDLYITHSMFTIVGEGKTHRIELEVIG